MGISAEGIKKGAMFIILFFTVLGFLAGFIYVIIKRKIQPGKILAATFLGLLTLGIVKMLKEYYKKGFKQGGGRWGY